MNQTLLRFGGRQPLCGIGVTSRIDRTSRPAVCSARIADSRPEPGPLTSTSHERMPNVLAALVALSAAWVAANGVPLREPLKPIAPAGASVALGALPAERQVAAMPAAAIAANFTQPLDLHRDLLAEIAFDATLLLEHAGDLADVVFGQILDTHVGADPGLRQDDVR